MPNILARIKLSRRTVHVTKGTNALLWDAVFVEMHPGTEEEKEVEKEIETGELKTGWGLHLLFRPLEEVQ